MRVVVLGGMLVLQGCATDLRVGVDTDVGSGESGSSGRTEDTATSASEAGSGTEDEDTAALLTESHGSSGDSSNPSSSTTSSEPGSEGGEEEGTGGPPPPCTAKTQQECLAQRQCQWVGEPSQCVLDPCASASECGELDDEACLDAIACAWVGKVEGGTCEAIECVPCEALDAERCGSVEGCTYSVRAMACVEA